MGSVRENKKWVKLDTLATRNLLLPMVGLGRGWPHSQRARHRSSLVVIGLDLVDFSSSLAVRGLDARETASGLVGL